MSHTTSGVSRHSGARIAWLGLMVAVAAIGTSGVGVAQGPARTMPVFAVDTTWPNLPNNWSPDRSSSHASGEVTCA